MIRRNIGVALAAASVVGTGWAAHTTTPATTATCVHLNTLTCTTVPSSPALTNGSIAAGNYQDDENGPRQGWMVTDTGRDTLDAIAAGYTCLDIGPSHLGGGKRAYICILRLS